MFTQISARILALSALLVIPIGGNAQPLELSVEWSVAWIVEFFNVSDNFKQVVVREGGTSMHYLRLDLGAHRVTFHVDLPDGHCGISRGAVQYWDDNCDGTLDAVGLVDAEGGVEMIAVDEATTRQYERLVEFYADSLNLLSTLINPDLFEQNMAWAASIAPANRLEEARNHFLRLIEAQPFDADGGLSLTFSAHLGSITYRLALDYDFENRFLVTMNETGGEYVLYDLDRDGMAEGLGQFTHPGSLETATRLDVAQDDLERLWIVHLSTLADLAENLRWFEAE